MRTIKGRGSLRRAEVEEAVDARLFALLWPATEGHRLRKRRHVVPAGAEGESAHGLHWEVDEVLSGPRAGLVLLEVELPPATAAADARAATPPFPAWLAPFVQEEVTETFSSAQLVGLGGSGGGGGD